MSQFVRIINGITFIDAIALEGSITRSIPAKDRLRQKMINADVEFWNAAQTIIKKPMIGISAIGGFSVSLEGDIPPGMIKLRMGALTMGPMTPESLAAGLQETMGMQSSHTYMNPYGKTASELYGSTVKHGHFSIAHAAFLSIHVLGLSKKAELEFDVQRDVVHLARETSARSACQDAPTLVAMTEHGAMFSQEVLEHLKGILATFPKGEHALDYSEERNSLYPLSASVSLGINSTLRNFQKLLGDINSEGKELEYRNILALINDSLHGLFPELFKSTAALGHQYPSHWVKRSPLPPPPESKIGFFSVAEASRVKAAEPKKMILLLGAPGVGKSTQTAWIVKQLPQVMCVSTGNLVRNLEKKVTEGKEPLSAIEQKAAESLDRMKRGELMDDDAVYALLMAHLSFGGEGHEEYLRSHTIIMDGVIKAASNIRSFEAALHAFNERASSIPLSLQAVIHLSASEDELLSRHQARVMRATAEGIRQRPDDALDIYRERLKGYISNIPGVIEHYKASHPVLDIDSSQGIEGTTICLLHAIEHGSLVDVVACAHST